MKFLLALTFIFGMQNANCLTLSHNSGVFRVKHLDCYRDSDCKAR